MSVRSPGPGPARPQPAVARPVTGSGLAYGLSAYLLWGILPLYIAATAPAPAAEIVVLRIGFTLVVCLVLLAVLRRFRDLARLLTSPRRLGITALAAVLVAANWAVYTIAVTSGQTLEAALGYFINPLVSVFLGVLMLGERLRRAQWVSVGISVVAVIVLTVGHGQIPWIALALAVSFGLYGLVKNRLGPTVHPVASLGAETVVLIPVFVVGLPWLSSAGMLTILDHGAGHFWVLAASGLVTAVPLILFGTAAGRLPLSVLGLMQYMAPVMQFLVGLLVFHEHMSTGRLAGFILIWVALVILTADTLHHTRHARRLGRTQR